MSSDLRTNVVASTRPSWSSEAAPATRAERREWAPGVILAVVGVMSVLVIVCLALVFWISFVHGAPDDPAKTYTLENYRTVIADERTYTVLWNTFGFSFASLSVAFAFGVPAAWLVERTNIRGKAAIFTMMTVGLLIPTFVSAMGWLFLLHPRIGLVNVWIMDLFGLREGPINILSVPGMGWVEGLALAPLAFIMTAAVFKAMDPSLEEAASMSGAGPSTTLRVVTLPLAWPGILAAGIYIFTIGFAAFDVPAVLGMANRVFTFSTYLYLLTRPEEALPRYGFAAALSAFIALLACAMSWWYASMQKRARAYSVVSGKAYRPRIIDLGGRVWIAWTFLCLYFLLVSVLPIIVVVWASLLPYFQLPSAMAFSQVSLRHYDALNWGLVLRGFSNTAILMALTPTLTLAISLCFSWVVLRSRLRGRALFDLVAFLPHAVPNIVFGVGTLLLAVYVLQTFLPIYGTIWVLLFVFLIARVAYGTRMTNSGLIQIHPELEESAALSGATLWQTLRRIVLPLLTPTLIYAWLWIALLTYRELTLSVILTTPRNMTLPLVVWTTFLGGGLAQSSALIVVMLGFMLPLMGLYWFVAGRRGLLSV
jgi:iron(III) transport system permease protein